MPEWENGAVRAAGGVPVREGKKGLELLVVHRPRYDDWTFPKGKREPGETDEECAVREVEEETGLACELGPELPATRYVDGHGRPKVVRYWRMRPLSDALRLEHEADDARWVVPREAERLLTYERDRAVLAEVSDFKSDTWR
jgi:8-oxo-dGTP pyrophosphatase MutT (NUDIX family)